jgi:hypothetical protein
LGSRYGFSAFDQGGNEILVVPVRDVGDAPVDPIVLDQLKEDQREVVERGSDGNQSRSTPVESGNLHAGSKLDSGL